MYRNCIFCAGELGGNTAIPAFPVGRSVAFDGVRGRLWAVCPRCARWNLAPLEERWEAIEEAERAFRDTRLRAQSENVGLARLPDGTRLVRVGKALAGELAAWRYGSRLVSRHRRRIAINTVSVVGGLLTFPIAGIVGPGIHRGLAWMTDVATFGWRGRRTALEQRVPASLSPTGAPMVLPRGAVIDAHLDEGADGDVLLRVPVFGRRRERSAAEFQGDAARTVLSRAMLMINHGGASRGDVRFAVDALAAAPSAEAYIRTVARNRGVLGGQRAEGTHKLTPTGLRALEMALHEEQERRVLEGELAGLEAMWRQAEEIAAIADALPDTVPAPEPPRLIVG
jgi:hypothetical protein